MAGIRRIFIDKTTNKKYQPVEFIDTGHAGSTTAGSTFQLDYTANAKTIWELDIAYKDYTLSTNVNGVIERIGGVNNRFEITAYQSKWYFGLGSGYSTTAADNLRHKFKINSPNKKIYVDGVAQTASPSGLSMAQSCTLAIGARRDGAESGAYNGYAGEYIYGSKIWETSDTDANLKLDLIPVKEIGSDTYGLFDNVGKKFYGNTGTVKETGGKILQEIQSPIHVDATSKKVYEEVEYIESDETAYIDTGWKITENSGTYKYGVNLKTNSQAATVAVSPFGAYGSNVRNGYFYSASGSSNYSIAIGSGERLSTPRPYSDFAQYEIGIDAAGKTVSLTKDGQSVGSTTYAGSLITGVNMGLFICNGTTVTESVKMKLFYISANGALVRDYVPVKEKDGTEYGMFDRIENKFYGNANTTGAFTGGNLIGDAKSILHTDTTNNKVYEEVERIKFDVTSYINMGITASQVYAYETKVLKVDNTAQQSPFGVYLGSNVANHVTPFATSGNTVRWYNGTSNGTLGTFDLENPNTIGYSKSDNIIYNKKDDGTVLGSATITLTTDTTTKWVLGGLASTTSGAMSQSWTGYVWYFWAKDADGNFIRNFIPVKEKDGDVYGMFDTVENKFYGNVATSGTITGGDVIKTYGIIEVPVKRAPYRDAETGRRFEKVEFIKSTGTQFIDTGISANRSQPTIEISIKDATNNGNLFGAYNGASAWTEGWGLFLQRSSNRLYIHYKVNQAISNQGFATAVYKVDRNKVYVNGTLVHTQGTVDSGAVTPTIYLLSGNFGDGTYATATNGKCDWSKLYVDDVLVRDYIAVREVGGSGEYGLFDTVNNKFYGNAGTGSFTGGNAVTDILKVKAMKRVSDGKFLTLAKFE